MIEMAERAERHPIQCDCCGEEVIAVLVGDRLIIKQKRHGRVHQGVIVLSDLRSNANQPHTSTDGN